MPDVRRCPIARRGRVAVSREKKPIPSGWRGPLSAGDVIGDYSFDSPLNVGDRVVFEDMALYYDG
jgi:carboxynorspermidine decarboxylase